MRFSTLILTALGVVATVICAPLNAQSELEARNETTALRDHGPPYCDHEPPGMCTVSFYERYYPDNPPVTRIRNELFIYDRYTKLIGAKIPIEAGHWVTVYSELPYAVVASMDRRDFKYAGVFYYHESCTQYADYNGAPLPHARITQCTFDCSKPGGQKRSDFEEIEARGEMGSAALASTLERSSTELPALVEAGEKISV